MKVQRFAAMFGAMCLLSTSAAAVGGPVFAETAADAEEQSIEITLRDGQLCSNQSNVVLAVLETEGQYTVTEAGAPGSVLYRFDDTGIGTAVSGVYRGKYYQAGVLQSGSIQYHVLDDRLYQIKADGTASVYRKDTGKSGTYPKVADGICYAVSYATGKVRPYTGLSGGSYYVAGNLLTGSVQYRILEGKLYQIRKDGSAAVYRRDPKKSGTYPKLLDGTCYSVSYQTGKVGKFTGVYQRIYYKAGKPGSGWYAKSASSKSYYRGGKAVTGVQKLNGSYYFFRANGVLAVKDTAENGTTYYIHAKGHLEARRKGNVYQTAAGRKMTQEQQLDYTVLRSARQIVRKITNDNMTPSEKLQKCFDYVIGFRYQQYRKFPGPMASAWPAVYANDHILRGAGDCHSDAALFAYLARAIGYTDVYVCLDAPLRNPNSHCWTMVNGRHYDPLFAEAKSYSAYYAASSYTLSPIVKVRVAVGYTAA